jgi:hypothetical protein
MELSCCRRNGVFVLISLMLLGAGSGLAAEQSWRIELPASNVSTFRPTGAEPLPGGGFLVGARTPEGREWTLRFDADGEFIAMQPSASAPAAIDVSVSKAGLLSRWRYQYLDLITPLDMANLCELQRGVLGGSDLRIFDPHLWRPRPGGDAAKDAIGGHATSFISGFGPQGAFLDIVRFARDCQPQLLTREDDLVDTATIPGGDGAYLLREGATTQAEKVPARLKRVGTAGVVWEIDLPQAPTDADQAESHLSVAASGDVLVHRSFAGPETRMELTRVDPEGGILWSYSRAGEQGYGSSVTDGDNTYWFVSPETIPRRHEVYALDAAGAKRWSQSLGTYTFERELPGTDPGVGPRWKLVQRLDASYTITNISVVRPGPEGLVEVLPPRADRDPLAVLGDGSILALESPAAPAFPRLLRIMPGDAETQVTMPEVADVPRVPGLKHTAEAAYIVTTDGRRVPTLARVSNDGNIDWKVDLPSHPVPAGAAGHEFAYRIATGAERVCVWRVGRAERATGFACRARADGGALHGWTTFDELSIDIDGAARFEVGDDGGVSAIGTGCSWDITLPDGACVYRTVALALDAQGTVQRDEVLLERSSSQSAVTTAASRNATAIALGEEVRVSGKLRVSLFNAAGQRRWERELTGRGQVIAAGDDGSVLALVGHGLVDFGVDGDVRWTRALGEESSNYTTRAAILPDGDRIVFVEASGQRRTRLRLRPGDGSAVWEHASRSADSQFRLAQQRLEVLDATSIVILVPTSRYAPSRLAAFDLVDGQPFAAWDLPRAANPGYASRIRDVTAPGPDGSLLIASLASQEDAIELVHVSAPKLRGPERDALSPSLLGAWSAASTSGQGLMLDFDPALGLVYGGWFTYDGRGGHDSGRQRWYTLLGSPSSEGEATELDLFRNAEGTFLSGNTTAEKVGTARLRVLDCNEAVLSYRFDTSVESGSEGVIPLRRIAPATRGCEGAGASDAAALARRSGAWRIPGVSGQGLLLDLRPPAGDDAGFVAGAWYTFAPEGKARDPLAQHWFTLAGTWSESEDGSLRVPVWRSIGGALDARPTSNTWQVGEVTLTFSACDRARLDYAFLDDPIAHAFAGLQGSLQIERIGACAP